jgi:hypothetical protein
MVGIGWQAAAGRRGSQRGIPARQEARLGDPQSPTTQYSRHDSRLFPIYRFYVL